MIILPIHDYKQNQEHYCYQEPRLTAIETKLATKKENLHEVHEDYYHLRDKLETISENVVELTAIMRENQKKEETNDKKIDDLTRELGVINTKIEKTNSSIDTMKWLIPIACTILTFLLNYLI